MQRIYILVNGTATVPAGSCHGFYDRAANGLFLYDDSIRTLSGPLTPGTAGTLRNSQYMIDGVTSQLVSAAGTSLTLQLGIRLQGGFAAAEQKLYIWIRDNESNDTGWVQASMWSPPAGPAASGIVSAAPANAMGSPQTFRFVLRDPHGYADLQRLDFLVHSDATVPPDSCHGFYDRAANGIFLYNYALSALLGPMTPGSAGTLENSRCTVHGSLLQLAGTAGTDLTLELGVSLRAGSRRCRKISIYGCRTTRAMGRDGCRSALGARRRAVVIQAW